MLCIKTGMQNEYDIAKRYAAPGTLILSGQQTVADLQQQVPADCKAIMSFGMSGGLRPQLPIVGQTVIASFLVDDQSNSYIPDLAWTKRLFAATHFYASRYYSSGRYNESNTPSQRAAIYARTQAWCVDDESLWVAQFAKARGIPFAILRNVSDAWNDDVSITSNILSVNGGANPLAVLKDVFTDPLTMEKIAVHYQTSQSQLEQAARLVGPTFGWGGISP